MNRYFWLGLLALWSAAQPGYAQQLLCERTLVGPASSSGNSGLIASGLLRLQADSLRLLGDYRLSQAFSLQPGTTALRRVVAATCDTLPVPGSRWPLPIRLGSTVSRGLVTRRGSVLMSNSDGTSLVQLRLLGRDGQPRWTRTLASGQIVATLLGAPDRGFFVATNTAQVSWLTRLDSLGNVLWRRQLGRGGFFALAAAYTRTDNLLLYGAGQRDSNVSVQEVSQNGDTLRRLNPAASLAPALSDTNPFDIEHLQPLRDGGFLLTATTDSVTSGGVGTGYERSSLIRLNSSLQVVWTSTYWAYPAGSYNISSPFELADGSLVAFVRRDGSGYLGQPYWLFHYSAGGQLLQRYAFSSPALTALHQPGRGGDVRLVGLTGMQPLSDSSFVLAANVDTPMPNRQLRLVVYLAHLKVPGLRRVVLTNYIPAANSPLATHAPAATFPAPAYPNPAREAVTVPLPPGPAPGTLRLRDLTGRLVREQATPAGVAQVTLPLTGLAQGLYLLQFQRAGLPPAVQRLAVGP